MLFHKLGRGAITSPPDWIHWLSLDSVRIYSCHILAWPAYRIRACVTGSRDAMTSLLSESGVVHAIYRLKQPLDAAAPC